MDIGSVAFTLLSVIAAVAAVFLMSIVKELRVQHDSSWGDSTSLASGSDDDPPRLSRRRGGRRPLDKQKASHLLFRPKTFCDVWRWLEDLGVPSRDRKDECQNVFLQASKSFHTYIPERSRPERWIHQIAVHVAANYRKLARHRYELLTPVDPTGITDPSHEPEDSIARHQARSVVLELLQSIDGNLRTVLIAHEINGISMKEIAMQLGIPLSTAYKWNARARCALRELAEERLRAEERAMQNPGTKGRHLAKPRGPR